MTPQDFCYWLHGFAELNGSQPTPEQWQSIREHLALVFNKVTPKIRPGDYSPWPAAVPMTTPYVTPWDQWHGTKKIDLTPKC